MSEYRFFKWYVPPRMMEAMLRYTEHGVVPGDFLQAVITNDLREACFRADDENLANLPAFVAWLYNEAPAQCWGSEKKMLAWAKSKQKARKEGEEHED